MKVEHRGFVAEQAPNNHICIQEVGGPACCHMVNTVPMSEDELRAAIDEYLLVREQLDPIPVTDNV